VRLIPVNDKLLDAAVADDVLADLIVLAVDVLEVGVLRLVQVEDPAGPRETVLRGVHRLTGPLAGEVADKEADWWLWACFCRWLEGIDAIEEIAFAEDLERVGDWIMCRAPTARSHLFEPSYKTNMQAHYQGMLH